MATVRHNNAPSANERAPALALSTAVAALLAAGNITAWWDATGMVEGVKAGSTLPVRWKHALDSQSFPNSFIPAGDAMPVHLHDNAIGRDFLRFGYDGTRRTLTLAGLFTAAGGAGYALGDTVELTGGVVIRKTGSNTVGPFINEANFVIEDYGSFTEQPTSLLEQVSTNGTGSGATFLPMMATDCGSLDLLPTAQMIPDSSFSIITVFRCPTVEEQAESGGFLFGSQLQESEVYHTGNARYWGMRVGNQAAGEGVLNFHDKGDGARSSVGGDKRDGLWHVAIGCIPAPGSPPRLWVDGVLNDNRVGGNFTSLNATAGNRYLRVGAAGLPTQGPTGGFCGDIALLAIVPFDLNLAANAALRIAITQALLDIYKPGLLAA
ncbi:hypothetical protein [Novosphingobium guangzhouense]|uniref:Uncharacterized protein n=1 Tax=Novosphingobium guangzhouense TaxID=1850347 RepID=A0A2K2G431_9SPHN|nr:hypothetical protein [Novosphingobium guangzhouense]PNU05800.1 hypothetical protein A8V01_14640 [Novosphingobium guangzhouense]